ncbi:MAG: arginine--tRNA ligase [Brumimicrobium sp.]|nr:arginine--tRNA ligase [Brumimicrobium sp.]
MEDIIKKLLLENAESLFGEEITDNLIQFQKTRKDVEGDFTLVTFPFVKLLKSSPEQAGEKIGHFLQENISEIAGFNVIKGFLNLHLKDEFWLDKLVRMHSDDRYGQAVRKSGKTFMVEYSSPNTNKPLHLGHLRNNFLGYSVAEILKANGHEVIKTQIVNDRGIHICKSMLAWQRFAPTDEKGNRETPATSGIKGDHFVGKYYIEFENQLIQEAFTIANKWRQENYTECDPDSKEKLEGLFKAYDEATDPEIKKKLFRKIGAEAKDETTLLEDAQEMLVKWEARDPETYLLWSTMNGWVYEGFASTYHRMGVDFDKLYYESDTFLIGKDLVVEGLNKGIFFKKEDGSVWVDLSEEGLDEKLLLRGDGTAVYMTQDIGTAIDRFKDFPSLNGIIYTVGNEQDYHFQVLFLILKKLGYDWADNCYHLSYGMVDLPHGKMKSREGTVVDADDLMEQIVSMAKESTKERGHLEGMSETEKETLYETIGMGGLKYFLLKVDPHKRMKFNPDESIELNGNTGPFIQYAHARIQSLLAKVGRVNETEGLKINSPEKELIKLLNDYPSVVEEAGSNYSPALIANYTFELVKEFNAFYQAYSIMNEPDEHLKNTRIVLCEIMAGVIASAMKLLGITVPERM